MRRAEGRYFGLVGSSSQSRRYLGAAKGIYSVLTVKGMGAIHSELSGQDGTMPTLKVFCRPYDGPAKGTSILLYEGPLPLS